MRIGSIVLWTLAFGVLWNGLGWAGNNLLLGADWDVVGARVTQDFTPPVGGLAREAVTLIPDFVYAFTFVWLFAQLRVQSVASSLALVVVVWLAGAVVTYIAIVNSGFLPLNIALKTGVLALVIFLITAPILPLATKRPVGS
jgi:hypothetical protein